MWKIKKVKTKNDIIKWFILIIIATGSFTTIKDNSTIEPIEIIEINYQRISTTTIRRISAYNAGVIAQCDNSPCISANGTNICDLLDKGVNVCACNNLPFNTEIEIEGFGRCVILDRLNKRYINGEIDLAFPPDKIKEAIIWGIKYLEVKVYK